MNAQNVVRSAGSPVVATATPMPPTTAAAQITASVLTLDPKFSVISARPSGNGHTELRRQKCAALDRGESFGCQPFGELSAQRLKIVEGGVHRCPELVD